jgi:pimeloyl-ACP methyl ester carboxylesterase
MQNIKITIALILCTFCLSITGCNLVPDSVVPVKTIKYSLSHNKQTLLIFIPGIADDEFAFKKQGFLEQAIKRHLDVDIVSAHVHIGYVLDGTFLERVKEDLVKPAKQQGYRNIWLVGVSLGAFIGVNYMSEYPLDLNGLVLLGPYLGESSDINIIRQAGGIQAWQPNKVVALSKTLQFWYWYKQRSKHSGLKNIFLGFGDQDHLIDGIEQFKQLLPAKNVHRVEGGHNWHAWLRLWKQFLDDDLFH